MKIIHTSDWHLGHNLYNYDRSDEEAHFFKQLSDVVRREQPDALVVSGDIFHTGVPGNDVAKNFTDRLLDVLSECLTMETFIIAGNHDSYSRLIVDKELWRHHRVHVFGTPAEDAGGKADFAANVVDLGEKGLVAAVPYCHARNFPTVDGSNGADRQGEYFAGLADSVRERAKGRPSVLMAHLAVKGELDFRGQDKSLVVGGEECLGLSEIGEVYDYIALGHIHCPQWIKGRRMCARYCGTPRAIHFDETYDHGVDVVVVEPGNVELRSVLLPPLRALKTFGGEKGTSFDDALSQVSAADCAKETYVRFNVRLAADELMGADWTEKARKACLEKGLRFCTINPIREDAVKKEQISHHVLTMEELKKLSHEEVLKILSSRHTLTERQCDLVKSLMEEVFA